MRIGTHLNEGLYDGQGKSKRLAAASAGAANDVAAAHDGLEDRLLNGEERTDAALVESLNGRL